MFNRKNGKKVITILLVLSCVISGIMLASAPVEKGHVLQSYQEIDSLVTAHFQNARIAPSHIRTSSIQIDTILTRKLHQVRVPSDFSKTMFHIDLHQELDRYQIETPAKVRFPSRDMHIYLYKNDTVLRTIHLTTDTDLDSLYTE